jgi:hypothetical protein
MKWTIKAMFETNQIPLLMDLWGFHHELVWGSGVITQNTIQSYYIIKGMGYIYIIWIYCGVWHSFTYRS